MALKTRNNRRYYYQNQRVGRRVVTRYIGSGAVALLAAKLDAAERAERDAERAALDALRAELADTPPVARFTEALRLLVDAALIDAGYHRHKRSEWRKRRDSGRYE